MEIKVGDKLYRQCQSCFYMKHKFGKDYCLECESELVRISKYVKFGWRPSRYFSSRGEKILMKETAGKMYKDYFETVKDKWQKFIEEHRKFH
jgi:hypothetical protein